MASTHIPRSAAALLALAVTAGCGSTDHPATLTKAQVIARGARICKAAERRVEALPSPTTQHPFAKGTSSAEHQTARRFLAGYADALESSRVGLQRLAAPPQGRALLTGYLAQTGQVVRMLRSASHAADASVEGKANAAFELFDRASRDTAAYGFPKGVCASGSSG